MERSSVSKNLPVVECLYCKSKFQAHKSRKKSAPLEHVMCKMLGHFENNMTLKNVVCKNCNNYFSKLELSLGRDSVYGILYRSMAGLFNDTDFKVAVQHPRKKLALKVNHPEYGYVLVDLDLNTKNLFSVRLTDQFIFLNSTNGVAVNYPIYQIPHKSFLDAIGLPMHPPKFSFLGPEVSPFEMQTKILTIRKILKQKDIIRNMKGNKISRQPPLDQNSPLLFSSYIDEDIIRIIAKISFNYFTKIFGREIANKSYFNDVRHFILYGLKTSYQLVSMDKFPINEKVHTIDKNNFDRHHILIYQEGHRILSKVILFNRDIFRVILTQEYPLLAAGLKSGHTFSLTNKTIQDLNMRPFD